MPTNHVPINYLAFVEWPCKPVRFNDGESDFMCATCICKVRVTPTRLALAGHEVGCRIAQRNAALQAAHAMQAREQEAQRLLDLASDELQCDCYGEKRCLAHRISDFLWPVVLPDAPAARTEKEE